MSPAPSGCHAFEEVTSGAAFATRGVHAGYTARGSPAAGRHAGWPAAAWCVSVEEGVMSCAAVGGASPGPGGHEGPAVLKLY